MRKRVKLLSLLLAFAMLLTLAGCSSSGKNEPVYFRLGVGEADSYNPFFGYKTVAYYGFALVYDPLFNFEPDYETIDYRLATSYDVSADGLTYTFHLREGVKWTDGEPFTADDVAFTLTYTPKYSSAFSYDTSNIDTDSIKVVDEHTVQFNVFEDANGFLGYLAGVPIVPKHIWSQYLESDNPESVYDVKCTTDNMVGTGLYKYYSEDESSAVFQLNKDYWGDKGDADVVVLEYNIADDAALAALQSGELDGAQSVIPSAVDALKSDKSLDYCLGMSFGFFGIGMNLHTADEGSTANPALQVREVRQAIDWCTQRQYLMQMAYSGLGAANWSFLTPNDKYYYDMHQYSGFRDSDADGNIASAVALLESAGFTLNASGQPYGDADVTAGTPRYNAAGQSLSFRIFVESDNVSYDSCATLIAAQCAKAGIQLNISRYDQSTLWSYTDARDYDMYLIEWAGYRDPDFCAALFAWDDGKFDYAGSGYNDSGYANDHYDELYYKQRYAHDESERRAALDEMQQIVYDDCPYIILGSYYYIQAVNSSRWSGYARFPSDSEYGMMYDYNIFRYNLQHMKYVG